MAESTKNIRTCRFCGKQYRYCNCEEYAHLPKFMLAFCGQNCNDLDVILSHYGAGLIDAETAYEQLKDKDVSRIEFWGESFRNVYHDIMQKAGVENPSAEQENNAQEFIPEEPIGDVVTEAVEELEEPKHQPKYKAEIKRNKQK